VLRTAKSLFSKLRLGLAVGVTAIALSACGSTNWGFPYKTDVQQGNWITSEQVAQLRKGMTPDQVRFILGTPTLRDALHADRWDYPYLNLPGYGKKQERNFTVWFKNGVLDHWEGDPQPDRQPYQKTDTGMTTPTDNKKPDEPTDKEAAKAARQAKHPRLKLQQSPNPSHDPSTGGSGTQPLL